MFFSAADRQFAKVARIDIGDGEVELPARTERQAPDPEWSAEDWQAYAEQLEEDVETAGRDRVAGALAADVVSKRNDNLQTALFLCAVVITGLLVMRAVGV